MKPNKSQIAEVPPAKQKRQARIQPRTILGVVVSCLAAGAFATYAATGGHFSFPKSSSSKSSAPVNNKVVSTTVVKSGAKAQLLGETKTGGTGTGGTKKAKKGGFILTQSGGLVIQPSSIVGDGISGNNLSEYNLTPGSGSDERDASISPTGSYIVFRSNGADTNNDKRLDNAVPATGAKYHIWVGKIQNQAGGTALLDVYQVTGKNSASLSAYSQFRPVWSPNGTQVAFTSEAGNAADTAQQQLYVVTLNLNSSGVPNPSAPFALTQFLGPKSSPTWAPGNDIVFSAKRTAPLNVATNSFDLYRISSLGQSAFFQRITGNANDPNGDVAGVDDLNPAYSTIDTNTIYFSSNRTAGEGRRIWKINVDGTGATKVTDPTLRPFGAVADNDDFPTTSLPNAQNGPFPGSTVIEAVAFQTNSRIDSSDQTKDNNIWATSTGGEASVAAVLITNILSSPTNAAASDLSGAGVVEDKLEDIEPAYGRSDLTTPTNESKVQLAFSSNRLRAPNPSGTLSSSSGSYDLWITAAADVVAPVIQPDNNNYPLLSPVHNPGSFSSNNQIGPRTPRAGLNTQTGVKLALLVNEKGSGLSKVSFAFYDADEVNRFIADPDTNPINEGSIRGITNREYAGLWPSVPGFGFNDLVVDLSKASSDINYYSDKGFGAQAERQSGAVAGDGIYYIAKPAAMPATPGDYYISVRIEDRSGNSSYYSFIWGFSTKDFVPNRANDLFVSDQTAGQLVTTTVRGLESTEEGSSPPVESYYLDNVSTGVEPTLGTASATPRTFVNVDTWRIMCRGPLDDDLITSYYIPSKVTQVNPNKFDNGFQLSDKEFADVPRVVLWAAPFAGTYEVLFDTPGSLKQGATQAQLRHLLEAGGRLFLTGRNALSALNEGLVANTFGSDELYAKAEGKVELKAADAVDPLSGNNAFPELRYGIFFAEYMRPAYSDLEFARVFPRDDKENVYRDGSYSHFSINGGTQNLYERTDSFSSITGAGVQTFPAYTVGGKTIGQRIIKKRSDNADSGLESRAVFFSFNFDAVNRRYGKFNNPNRIESLDVRLDIANGIRQWMKTGGISGRVLDNNNNPVPNFLVYALSEKGTYYYARTDASGQYEFKGLPAAETFQINAVFNDQDGDGNDNDANDRDDLLQDDINRNYFNAVGFTPFYIIPGDILPGLDVRVEKISPATVSGRVFAYQGNDPNANPLDRTLHTAVNPIQLLLKVTTVSPNSTTTPYARLTTTIANGSFSFADAPPNRDLTLIINPTVDDIPEGSDLQDSGIQYNSNFGRRVIPVDNDKRRRGDINGLQNATFTVNDTYINQPNNFDIETYPTPPLDTAADEGGPLVISRGEPLSGKFTYKAGQDAVVTGAGWKVELLDATGTVVKSSVTTADGTFTFSEVVGGTYTIRGTVPASLVAGYSQLTAQLGPFDTTTLTQPQKAARNLQAIIAHVQGSVKINGQYVSGAQVTLRDKTTNNVVSFGGIDRKSTSGLVVGSANYFIGYVPNGDYNLVVDLPDGAASQTRAITINATARPLQTENFDFNISEVQVNVSTLYAGLPKDGILVQFFKTTAPTVVAKFGNTDANGSVTIRGVDLGTYNVKATKAINGVTATATQSNYTVRAGSNVLNGLVLKWDSLKGVVKLNNVVQSGARVQFFLGAQELTALEVTTDSTGAFEAGKTSSGALAQPLAPGNYTVRASIVVGGLTLSQDKTVTLSTTPLGQIVNIGEFNFGTSYVTGLVKLNGSPASGFNVVLYNSNGTTPFTDSGGAGRTATTDASGRYRLDYVPSGTNNFVIKATRQFNSITAAGQVSLPTVNPSGETRANDINITVAGGLKGVVTVNGIGTGGARLQVIDKKSKLPVSSAVTSDASGNYFIAGLLDGDYKLNADYSEGGFALKTLTKAFKVKGGVYKPNVINFDFKVTRLTGKVNANGKPAEGATVVLLDKKGAALKQPVSTTTDASGNYVLSGVKSGTYRVQASLSGSSAYVEVKVGNLKTTIAPLINLTRQELEATTVIRVGANGAQRIAAGANIEILSSTGNSLGTGFAKTTDANGKASFYGLASGTYRARVSTQGVTTVTTFSVGAGFTALTFPITLSQSRDLISLSESNNLRTTELGGIDILRVSLLVKPTSNVQVTLTASTPAEARFTNGNTVTLTFTTTNWNVGQTVTIVGQDDGQDDGDEVFSIAGTISSSDTLYSAIPAFTLSGVNFAGTAAPTTGPTFPANSKNLVSTPFTGIDGTISVQTVFGTTGYSLYRFNAAGQKSLFLTPGGIFPGSDWILMGANDKLERGRGYLLVTGSLPVTMLIPANPTVFEGDTFAVDVVRNVNYEAQTGGSNLNNGYDLIGFPFDPTNVSGFNIFEAQVLTEGILYASYAEAAAAGKVSNRIYTVDTLGRPRELAPADSTIRPYRGYFVKIFTDSAKIIFKANPTSGSGASAVGASTVKNSSVKSF